MRKVEIISNLKLQILNLMSIKFTVIERAQPGVPGGGNKKWYANAITDGELTIDDLAKQIEKFSALYHPCFVLCISHILRIHHSQNLEKARRE